MQRAFSGVASTNGRSLVYPKINADFSDPCQGDIWGCRVAPPRVARHGV